MSNFDINVEIDKIVDKIALQLKTRMKAMVLRSEKQVLRQYIASQKDTTKSSIKTSKNNDVSKVSIKSEPVRRVHKRENQYASTDSSDSNSNSD
jgi:hypothetical protein